MNPARTTCGDGVKTTAGRESPLGRERHPGIAAHLRACGPCGEDFEGLLTALRHEAT